MAYPTTTEIALKSLCIYPQSGTSLSEQLTDCYQQFTEKFLKPVYPKTSIVKQTIFISQVNNTEYIQSKQKLLACAKDFFEVLPPTSIIPQSPENGTLVLEFTFLDGVQAEQITHREKNGLSWIVIHKEDIRILIATGKSSDSETGNILQQSNAAFNQIQNILSEEKMTFSDIIRQWNYIEQILRNEKHNNLSSQHYQIFNDVRSRFYQQASFINGYPSATGIGMDWGGIIIDIIAVTSENKKSVTTLKSPVQLDAYTYSKEVLAENNTISDFSRTTPKFERAKILLTPENKWIFISGTAAIKGQVSIPVLSVQLQTEMTIQNILSLISVENLNNHGINTAEKAIVSSLRVYVKYPKDLEKVKTICMNYFPQTPVNYVVADICRPELLVEIEGFASI